jgi:hypothetical protein
LSRLTEQARMAAREIITLNRLKLTEIYSEAHFELWFHIDCKVSE